MISLAIPTVERTGALPALLEPGQKVLPGFNNNKGTAQQQ